MQVDRGVMCHYRYFLGIKDTVEEARMDKHIIPKQSNVDRKEWREKCRKLLADHIGMDQSK